MGRGGRIHIDRQLSPAMASYQKELFGQYDNINTFDKFRFDDDSYDQDDIVDDLRDG